MEQFLFASARDQAPERLLADCLDQLGPPPEHANLGFVYASDHLADDLAHLVLELQRHLGAIGAILPILFITGHGDVPMAVRAMREGAVFVGHAATSGEDR